MESFSLVRAWLISCFLYISVKSQGHNVYDRSRQFYTFAPTFASHQYQDAGGYENQRYQGQQTFYDSQQRDPRGYGQQVDPYGNQISSYDPQFGNGASSYDGRQMDPRGGRSHLGDVLMGNQRDSFGSQHGGQGHIQQQQRDPRQGAQGEQELPHYIRNLLGREITIGQLDLPRHGGAGGGEQFASGVDAGGWDGNPDRQPGADSWADPFQGGAIPQIPAEFNGDFSMLNSTSTSQYPGNQGQQTSFW